MAVRGKVVKGKVLLKDAKSLPDGTEVEVRPVKKRKPRLPAKPAKPKAKLRPFSERFAAFIGKAKGLPPDMSENLDHYLYGVPKQK